MADPEHHGARYDFFLSRRGSVATVAREVTDVLTEKGYTVNVEDYDFRPGASFVEAMHEGIKNSRDLLILYTADYEASLYTRKEFTSFVAEQAQSREERHIIILRCEDVSLRGLLADVPFQDLVGVHDTQERKRRIIAAAERQSQAAPPPPRPFIGVPPRIASFTGRADELDRLDAILMHDKPVAVTQAVGRAAVQGMGGVGKTSLAVEYAHRYRKLYAGVCWCPADVRMGVLSTLAGLAVVLGATVEEADVERAAKAALRRLAEQRATWLLVYDNVTAPDHIVDLLPSAGARVLITSRFSDWREVADQVALDVLPLEEAIALLEGRTGRSDSVGAKTLAEALGCLPLALGHAAAYCKRTQMRFADYANKASSLIDAAPRGATYPRSIAATFNLAISEAVAQCQRAEALMAYLAHCAPERIPITLVEGAVEGEAECMQAISALAEVSLLKPDQPFEDSTPAVTVHRLVQAVARARAGEKGMARSATVCITARLSALYPRDGDNPQSWQLCAQLTPHVIAQAAGAEEMSTLPNWSVLLSRAGSYFWGRGSFGQAALLVRDALSIREKTLGPEHPDTAESLNDLGLLLHLQDDLEQARPLSERALAIREKVLGSEHPDTARSLNNLAHVLRVQGDLAGARPLHERALAIREKMLGPNHRDTAESLHNLAALLQAQGDLVGARPLYERALAIREKVLGPEHPDTATATNNLARLLRATGHVNEAERLFRKAIAIGEKVLSRDHSLTQQYARDYACLLLDTERVAEALTIAQSTLAIQEAVAGRNHRWTKLSARVTADALDALGRAEEAEALRERYGLLPPQGSNS
jgi:tetratricopeptide (TPR) repeat protein